MTERPSHILALDSTGRRMHSFGRTGDGPGEFRNLWGIYWSDGLIVAIDAAGHRVSWFSEDGQLVDSRRMESSPLPGTGQRASPHAPLGEYFVGPARQEAKDGDLIEFQITLFRMDGSGNDSIIDEFLDIARYLPVSTGNWLPIPMLAGSRYAVDPQGSELVIVHQYAPENKDSAVFRVRKVADDGTLVFARSYHYTPSPIPRGYVEEFVEVRRDGIQGILGLSPREAERLINRYIPEFLTPFSEVRVGVDGSIWLKGQTAGADSVWWSVLNTRGDPVGRLLLPSRLRIRHIDGDTVWGLETDALGVYYLVRYRIARNM